jgi:streptomycin 6-kinase
VDRLVARFGSGVLVWVDELPERVARLAERWDLTVVRPLGGNTSHTLCCHRDGSTPVVLKVVPDLALAAEEHAALMAWESSPVVVRVLEADLAEGALLLEGLVPGSPAWGASDERVVELLDGLHRPPPEGFRPLADRIDFMFAMLRRRSPGYYDRAHTAALALAEDRGPRCCCTATCTPPTCWTPGRAGWW